jgi:hypothetical protein
MNIYKGQIVSNSDFEKSGKFSAVIPDLGHESYLVYYTSPYFTPNEGGMVAIPEPGSEILVIKNEEDIYYLSTIVYPPKKFFKGNFDKDYSLIKDKYLYSTRAKPQRVVFGDNKGNKLIFDNRYDKKIISAKTQLESGGGKVVGLNDSPGIDSVIVRTEHGDGLCISADKSDIMPSQSSELNTRGSQAYVARESSIDIVVLDGRDISVENKSTGANSDGVTGQYGNINITSQNKDISINADGFQGRIFLNTPDSTVQINTDGIVIFSKKDIKINTIGSIDLKATENVNIEGANVNINGLVGVNIKAAVYPNMIPPIPVITPNTVNGNTLAGPGSVEPIQPINLQTNDYNKPRL